MMPAAPLADPAYAPVVPSSPRRPLSAAARNPVRSAGARVVAPDLLDRLSLIAFDLYQRALPRAPGSSPVRIVDIDDASLATIGQWPWPRTIVAQLVDRLAAAGAAVVAFDIDFAEPDRTSPKMLLPLLARNGVDTADAEKLLSALPDPDQVLAAAMRKVPVALGFILTDRGEARAPAQKAGLCLCRRRPARPCRQFHPGCAEPAGVRGGGRRGRVFQPASRVGPCGAPRCR